ncbi:MAG TPA: DUF6612 family protein [Methanotrichaceae archaeon]|nr:DUF6612 family protein [Methanotrichaceae archaeon]
MMKKLILLALALVVVAFSGCIGNGPGESAPNATELKTMAIESAMKLKSYNFDLESTQNIVITNRSASTANTTNVAITASGQGSVNLTGRVMSVTSTMNVISDSANNVTPVETQTYFINDTIYSMVGNNWTRLQVPESDLLWQQQNMVAQQSELLNASTITVAGSETVNGLDCYKVTVVPDINVYAAILSQQMGSSLPLAYINLTELYQNGTEEWTAWITKDTHLLTKNDIRLVFTITPETMGLSPAAGDFQMKVNLQSVMNFKDFNQPIHVVLPAAAYSAQTLQLAAPEQSNISTA